MNVLWEERAKRPPEFDIISILAHSDLTNKMSLRERMGILILFLVGGNDTTRNSMSGGVWGLSQYPDERRKVRENPGLIPGLISEIIRWQTPVIHMRRTALDDAEIGGKPIKKGDKVVIWYISGNRDEEAIENPNALIADRPRPREHLSFGFGIHRCLGNRLAELQLRILWEEILNRDLKIEVLDKPVYAYSNFLRSIKSLPVRLALNDQRGVLGGKAGRRFSRCEARPSITSGPVNPRNSSASEVSNVGPIARSQLFNAYFVQRIALCAPSAKRVAISTAFASSSASSTESEMSPMRSASSPSTWSHSSR
jgi:hypothetical protein